MPPAALACNTGVSAVNVYSECLQGGGGGKPTGGGSANGGTNAGRTSTPISKQTQKTLNKAGTDQQSLKNLVTDIGPVRHLQSHSSTAKTPTAIGSAFDLGSGPTVLLIVLAGTAVILFAAGGFRSVRHRRP